MRYKSVHEFFTKHRIVHQTGNWRLTKELPGQINGLPGIRGLLIATDGILCYLEDEVGKAHQGHLGWFVPDKVEAIVDAEGITLRPAKKSTMLSTDLLKILEQMSS